MLTLLGTLSAIAVAAAAPLAKCANSQTGFSSIVVFGDSFSDNGNGSYRISNGTWPLVPPYYEGHFTNGPVWAQYVASNLSLPLYDYAVGGATTSNALIQGFTGPDSTIAVPSLTDQVTAFLSGLSPQNTTLPPASDQDSPLFVLWAGANDIFFNPNISAAQSHAALAAAAETLKSMGTVLTVASPDLSRLPYGIYVDEDGVGGKRALRAFTDLLAVLLADGTRRGAVDVNVDLRGLFDQFEYYAQPEAYGFGPLGKYGSCLVGVYGEGATGGMIEECDDSGSRVYWDEYHPTTWTHSWIAKEILNALS